MVEVVIALEPYERGGSVLGNGTDSTSNTRNRSSATPLLDKDSDRLVSILVTLFS